MRVSMWLSIVLLAACDGGKGGPDEGDTDQEGDADTDADADADADTDTDATGDTGGPAADCFADYTADVGVDGTIDTEGVDRYDAANEDQLVHLERDGSEGDPPDGVPDTSLDYTYDANGNVASLLQRFNLGPPLGVIDFFEEWTYDPATDLVLTYEADCVLESPYPGCFDGVADYGETSTYDANGNRTRYEIDADLDGAPDSVETTTYDASDRAVLRERDGDGDGVVDYSMTTVWDAAGLVGDYAEDVDGDGVIDNTSRYVLDAAGRVIEIVEDLGDDGVIDVRGVYAYTDPTLLSGTYTEDEGDDGVPELVETIVSDASGNVLSFSSDSSPDGAPDFEYTFTYDAATNLLLTQDFVNLSGAANAVDHSYEATLDAQGRIVATRYVETRHATGAVVYEEEEDWSFGGSCP